MIGLRSYCGDHCIHERRIIGRENAKGIADGVIEPACVKIELDMPGLLLGSRLVETGAGEEDRFGWIVSRASSRRRGGESLLAYRLGARRRGVQTRVLEQIFQHARGRLA